MATTGYTTGGSAAVGTGGVSVDQTTDYWSLAKCKRAYLDYIGNKRLEIEEQQDARRYRHGAQWTSAQIEALNKRKQPVVTYNRIARKIDGIVGLVEKLRQDPKAFPRTPKHEQGAELATAVLNYVLDEQEWKAKSPLVAEGAAVDGLAGIELELIEGDNDDKEVGIEVLDNEGFFYDPRSFRLDFSDARFMGIGKWVDPDVVKEMFPDKADAIDATIEVGGSSDLTTNSDRDNKWFSIEGQIKRIRLVDIWYQHKGGWCWAIFTGSMKLMEGRSYLKDEKNKDLCKFIVFSAAIDHDGDRYGFIRNLKSAQDEVNQRRSKGLHELATRRIIGEVGAFDDIETARREAARPDGVVLRNPGLQAEFDDTAKMANIEGQIKFLEDAKNEIENFSFNPALIGQGVESQSGRAIALMQEAGMAELGPYILAYRGWKIRVYRAIWNAVQRHWSAERWVRVTDDDGVAQFLKINELQKHPITGVPVLVNAIGSLDVDIILDEGPDHVNMMADTYEVLTGLAQGGMQMPPEALIEVSPLPSSMKKQLNEIIQQSKQQAQQMQERQFAHEMALKGNNTSDPQAQQAEMAAEISLKEQKQQADERIAVAKANSDIEIARVKAAAEIQLKREMASAEQAIDRDKANNQRQIEADSHEHKKQIESEKIKSDSEARTAPMKELVSALTAPKRARKMPDGSWIAEVVKETA